VVSILAIWFVLLGTYLVRRPDFWVDPAHHEKLVYATLATICGAALSSAMLWIFRPLGHDAPLSRRLVVLGASAVMLTLAHAALDVPLQLAVAPPHEPDAATMLFENAVFYLWAHGAAGALLTLLDLADVRRAREQAAAEAEVRSARRAASVLRLQIRPHFLFNALNGASALVLTDRAAEADKVLGALANLLRLSLQADPDASSTLGDEFEMAACYAAIEEIRFGHRLKIAFEAPRRLLGAQAPALLLLPVLERVVSHGLEGRGPVCVRVRAQAKAGELIVRVFSDRAEPPPEGWADDLEGEIGWALGGPRLEEERRSDGYSLTVRLPLHAPPIGRTPRVSKPRSPVGAEALVQ
jgi:hypothetical protein